MLYLLYVLRKKEGPDDRSGLFTHAPENGRNNGVRVTDVLSPPSHQYWLHGLIINFSEVVAPPVALLLRLCCGSDLNSDSYLPIYCGRCGSGGGVRGVTPFCHPGPFALSNG